MLPSGFSHLVILVWGSTPSPASLLPPELNCTTEQMVLIDIYRIYHPTTVEYTFFSAAHETFSKIYYILGNKASHKANAKKEIISCILSDQNEM
jgi:hypothetical protein